MQTPAEARRLMIYLGESDSWQGRSLYLSILETLRKSEIAGATVTRAIAGFGAHSRVRTNTLEVLSTDLPIVISVIDTPENIERACALVTPMVREGLMTIETVRIVKYTHRYLHPLPADRPVKEFMTRDVISAPPEAPVARIVELLLGKMFRAIPVVDGEGRVLGIITDSDLLARAGLPARLNVVARMEQEGADALVEQMATDKTAEQIMTRPVITARDDESMGHAADRLVRHQLTRMPVVNARGRLVGMLSRLDILRSIVDSQPDVHETAEPLPKGRTLGEVMNPNVPAVRVNDDLAQVLQVMLASAIRRVIVLDEQDRPIGVITDGDVVARVSPSARGGVLAALAARVVGAEVHPGEATARRLMSERVLALGHETPIVDAIALLVREGRKHLVVLDDEGRPIGMADRQSLLAASIGQGQVG